MARRKNGAGSRYKAALSPLGRSMPAQKRRTNGKIMFGSKGDISQPLAKQRKFPKPPRRGSTA